MFLKDDLPLIINSCTCFLAFIVFGALAASLGSAIPLIALDLGTTSSSLGVTFTARGIGFALGALLAAYFINLKLMTHELLGCLALFIAGIMELTVPNVKSLWLLMVVYTVQGTAYGLLNTVSNFLLPELWGRRVQPWMQAMHSCFGIGAMIGPAMVGVLGYRTAFNLIGVSAVVPLLFHISTACLTIPPSSPPSSNSAANSSAKTSAGSESAYSQVATIDLEDDTIAVIEQSHADNVDSHKSENLIDAPMYLKLLISGFFLMYIGAEASFGGWISDYALEVHITESASKAAYLSAIFWGSLTAGRVFSIVTAIYLSATAMIRLQLALGIISTFLSMTIMNQSYGMAAFVSGFVGFALSAMYPVMITIVGDYGFKM